MIVVLAAASPARADDGEVIEVAGDAPDDARPPSYELSGDDIRQLAGANNDTLRAAEAMPGVARTPMGFGGLVLRGTSPRDSSVYLDGIEVPIAFHFGGVTSFYPSVLLRDVTLVPGGFDVSYGRAQGGIITLTSRDPRTDRWRVGGEVSAIQSGAYAEGPVAGGGLIVGVRRAYLDDIAGPFVGSDTPLPSAWDAQLRGAWGDSRTWGQVSPIVFASSDRISSERLRLSVDASFVRVAVPYLRSTGATTLHVVPWLGWGDVAFSYRGTIFQQEGIPPETLSRPTYPGGVRADVTRDAAWGDVRAGIELSATHASRLSGGGAMMTTAATWLDAAAWSEARVQIERLVIRPGVRVERYGLSDEAVLDPRLTIEQRLTDQLMLTAALGRYHQPPTVGDVDPRGGNPRLDGSYTDQLSLGVSGRLVAGFDASLVGYATYGHDIAVPLQLGLGQAQPDYGGFGPTFAELLEKELGTTTFRVAEGRARDAGVELGVRRSAGRWFGMLSYTLAWAQRTDAPSVAPGWHPYELDQRHDLNVAGSVRLGRWLVGARLTAVSGDPYSPITPDGKILPWAATLPPFVQLDLRADRRWHTGWGDLDGYVDIQNATDRRNLEGRPFDPSSGRQVDAPGLPIIPFIGLELVPR